MSDQNKNLQASRKKTHRKKTFWQVWFPFLISTILIITIAVFVVLLTFNSNFGDFHMKWSSISLVFLSIPVLITAFILLALLTGLIYLVWQLYIILPVYAQIVVEFLKKVSFYTRMVGDRITSPIISANSKLTGLRSI